MKSLFKSLDIIETLAETGGMGIRELSAETGLPAATTHRIVTALVARKYLQKTGKPPRYALAPKFLMLAESIQPHNELTPVVRPYLEKLMQLTGENANLCIHEGRHATYIDHVRSRKHNLRIFTRIGAHAPLYASGVGKIFLSSMPPDKLEGYLVNTEFKALTGHTITDVETLRGEIETIRKQQYAVDDQEKELGVRCIAAPLLNHKDEVVAAISISGAAQRITDRRVPGLGRMVKEAALKISQRLGCADKQQ